MIVCGTGISMFFRQSANLSAGILISNMTRFFQVNALLTVPKLNRQRLILKNTVGDRWSGLGGVNGVCSSNTKFRTRSKMFMWGEGPGSGARPASTSSTSSRGNNNSKNNHQKNWNDSFSSTTSSSTPAVGVDEEGRKVRTRSSSSSDTNRDRSVGGWDDDMNDNGQSSFSSSNGYSSGGGKAEAGGGGGWYDDLDDFDNSDGKNVAFAPYEYKKKSGPSFTSSTRRDNHQSRGRGRGRGRDNERGRGRGGRGGRGRESDRHNTNNSKQASELKINLRALEGAGFVHLYGLAPILNALHAKRRDLTNPETITDMDDFLSDEDVEHEMRQRERKPEAQYAPYLFIQDNILSKVGGAGSGGKIGDKIASARELEHVAREANVPVAYVDKGVLNTLSGNRPHQGYVLRCGQLDFEPMSQIPPPPSLNTSSDTNPSLWLVLDEVVDPQNFGALLRSAYFLGGNQDNPFTTSSLSSSSSQSIGIMICAKNSAPPTPVVSAASAGALELCTVYSTSNLPRTLNSARENGWRILGAAAAIPTGMAQSHDNSVTIQDLHDVDGNMPTILVLGSEGHGLRNLVARACSGFVRIPGGVDASANNFDVDNDITHTNVGVDSLNVSVTGGIMLWHLINKK